MLGDEDLAAVIFGEGLRGIEAHAEGCRVRPQQCDGVRELAALVAPAELRIGVEPIVAIGKAEVLSLFGQHVQLVLRDVL